jgi:succinoglycan biosynthesis transport protein ExoP
MIPKEGLDVKYFLAAFRRRFWYLVIPFFLVFMAAVIQCIRAKKVYQAHTLILVEPQRVPEKFVSSTVSVCVSDRLRTITDQIKSRTRLEEIIKEQNLYKEIRASSTMTDAVEAFRDNIDIRVRSGRGSQGSAAFEVSFSGRDPVKVRDVTDSIAKLFIEDNLKIREAQASGTTRFLDRELERMQGVLQGREEKLRQFKEKYMGLLPEQMQNNYRLLEQNQRHLDSVNASLQQTEDRKILVQNQLGRLEEFQAGTSATGSAGGSPRLVTLSDYRQALQRLRARYSDRHPDVVKLKATIAKLEEEQRAILSDTDLGDSTAATGGSGSRGLVDAQRYDQLAQLKLIEKELYNLREERDKTIRNIETYRGRIESAPKIEQMLVDLQRGYEQARQNYQSLLQKKLEAEMAENLERAQQGEQFRILDPAKAPDKPFKPKVLKFLLAGFILACGCGLGAAFVREFLDQTFWSRKEIESVLELPVLISIPVITTEKDRRWKRLRMTAIACVLIVMSSTMIFALILLWKKHPGFLPLPL